MSTTIEATATVIELYSGKHSALQRFKDGGSALFLHRATLEQEFTTEQAAKKYISKHSSRLTDMFILSTDRTLQASLSKFLAQEIATYKEGKITTPKH